MINPVHRTIITRRGSNVTLVCLGRNVEVLDTMAVWKFKGREIKDNTNKKATEKWLPGGRGNFTLHITNVSQRDVGQYTCSVLVANFNKADVAEGFMKLKLYGSGTFVVNVCFLGGVYMKPARRSFRYEFTPVPSCGSVCVYMIPAQNVMRERVITVRVHPGNCTGARFSFQDENSFRCHVNALRPFPPV